jgi:two-component system cell cycle sensor histidine kinase/response regulator CckA
VSRSLRLLHIEDNEDDGLLVVRHLKRVGFDPSALRVETAHDMRAALLTGSWDLIISDWSLPNFSALDALLVLKESARDVPLIIVSGTIDEETAIHALRSGARDFLVKSKLSRLGSAVERELVESESRRARHEAEARLLASESRYRALFENIPTPMWAVDLETLRFLAVNEAACAQYGYSEAEFLTMTLKDLRPADEVPDLMAAVSLPLDGRRVWRHRRKDGSSIHVEVRGHELVFEGRLARVALMTDVTERLELEHQLRQSQKMEAVGRLAGGIAHDFNNVLSVIMTCGDNLLMDVPEGPSHEDIDEILKAGRRAAQLTRQLLIFSRSQVLAPKVVDLNLVIGEMSGMLQRLLGADVEMTSLPDGSLGHVLIDPNSLEQVIMNLVVNARDAMPKGGKLTIVTENLVLDKEFADSHVGIAPGRHVVLSVADTGIGMDEQTMARIFEPFFTTKEVGRGTGLGLSTVFGIVQQSGGTVWVESKVGEGTTFRVYLPRVDAPSERERSQRPPPRVYGSETILLVEDEDQVRRSVRGILSRHGYNVIEARDAGEALIVAGTLAAPIHLLLTDVVMPRTSGPELAQRLGPTRPGMRILFMSGYTDDKLPRNGAGEEDVAFLQKPLTTESLTRKVREVLDGRGPEHCAPSPGAVVGA